MIDFLEVQDSVRELKGQLAARQIDERAFEDRLLEMIDQAEDGYYWMFGHKSERWFRHDGQKWIPADPSEILAIRSNDVRGRSNVEQINALEDLPVNWNWFIISLLLIFGIGWIVYWSTLG